MRPKLSWLPKRIPVEEMETPHKRLQRLLGVDCGCGTSRAMLPPSSFGGFFEGEPLTYWLCLECGRKIYPNMKEEK